MPSPIKTEDGSELVAGLGDFALDGAAEFAGEEVIRSGKVFELGDYPDKGFALTDEAEADAACAAFAPVNNDLEHGNTILSGKLGQLRSVWRQGKELFGKVAIPKWLHEAVGPEPIKTSLAWNKTTKRIVGNGLVLNPRIADAQLVAAFTAASNRTQGGAQNMPESTDTKRSWFEKMKALFSKKELPAEFADFDPEQIAFKDEPPATPPPVAPAKPTEPAAPETPASKPEFSESDGVRARLLTLEAEKFFEESLKANKVFPAEKPALVAQFRQAVQDDNQGKACFAADGAVQEGERVKMLRDAIAARPAHKLTTEQLEADPKDLVVLSMGGNGDRQTVKPERKAKLLELSGHRPKEAK